jgi:hypothetical protein
MQLGKTNAIKHSKGVVAYFRSHLNLNLSRWKEGSHDFYLWLLVNMGVAPNYDKSKAKEYLLALATNLGNL